MDISKYQCLNYQVDHQEPQDDRTPQDVLTPQDDRTPHDVLIPGRPHGDRHHLMIFVVLSLIPYLTVTI